jgi:hypothetical protein
MGSYSDFLYPQPSFPEGAGRILDFANALTRYNNSASPEEADTIALSADVSAVGEDMRRAIGQVKRDAFETAKAPDGDEAESEG